MTGSLKLAKEAYSASKVSEKTSKLLTITPTEVPTWVKNNARWWADGSIDDKDFVVGMQHLAQKNIIHVDKVYNQKVDSNQEIPEQIKNNAKWWADGLISDSDFVNGIQYLAQQGIIRVSQMKPVIIIAIMKR